jgi:hypothetical protein
MRIDATISDTDGKHLAKLAKELGLSRSELVSEAVSYFVRLSMEVRAGRLLLLHDPLGAAPPRELVSRHLGTFTTEPVPLPQLSERMPGQRPSGTADSAWRAEVARVRKLTPYERMAEAMELGDDDFGASAR